jgi:glucuronoarabinoxylan endo-1,4-beta-xylanase
MDFPSLLLREGALDRTLSYIGARRLAFLFVLVFLAGLAALLGGRTKAPRLKALLVITPLVVGFAVAVFLFSACIIDTAAITVNWASPQQTIDGFGAGTAGNVPMLTAAQMDFFYTDAGIHLKFIRLDIYPDLADCNANEGTGNCVSVSSGATLAAADLANAQAAVARGALVWASEWSPPGSMKSNRDFLTGGAMENGAGNVNFTALAAIQVSFVNLMTGTYGIPIYAISVQNEPDVSKSYPSCTWTAQQIHDYVPYLSMALASAGYSSTKIMVAEQGSWKNTYATTAMNDATVAADIGILAAHGYGGNAALLSYNNITKQHQWLTEISDFDPYDASIASGLTYATRIHDWLTIARVNSWQYWLLSGEDEFTDNEGLAGPGGKVAKRAYTLGNFSRFVQPGWVVVGVTNKTRLLVSAYKSRTSGAAIVVVNNGWTVRNQVFSVGTTMGASVIPWVTSSTANLAPQTPVAVSSGSFTYTIAASSVVTFSTSAIAP